MTTTQINTQSFRESLQALDLYSFNNVFKAHQDVIIKACKSDIRLRQVVKVKLESLKQNCHLKAFYLSMEI